MLYSIRTLAVFKPAHSAVLLDTDQNLIGVVHRGRPPSDHFDDLDSYDAGADSGMALDNHSFGDTFQDPTLYGLRTKGQNRHGATSFDVSDFENPFTKSETGLDVPQDRAFGSVQHESPYSFDAYDLGQEYSVMPTNILPTALAMGFNTTASPPCNTFLGE